MARRVSTSQLRSKIRQAQSKLRQADARRRQELTKLNQAIRKYNQDRRRAVNQYNQAVRAHNSRVRQNQARIRGALARLKNRNVGASLSSLHGSSRALHQVYCRLETRWEEEGVPQGQEWLAALTERETANSLESLTVALGDDPGSLAQEPLEETTITDELENIDTDLDSRWRGALFALSPRNPDAARHFCTSAREIFDRILVSRAPDEDVIREHPGCPRTQNGAPTRRARIGYLLHRGQLVDADVEEFVDRDIDGILRLFDVFNRGTHGAAGSFRLAELRSLKVRVEDGLQFLCKVVELA